VRAIVDYPACFYWKRLIQIYPEAKVVLTTRTSSTWRKSVYDTIYQIFLRFYSFPINLVRNLIGLGSRIDVATAVCTAIVPGLERSVISAVEAGDEEAIKFFEAWQEDVKANVPKENLLVFQVSN